MVIESQITQMFLEKIVLALVIGALLGLEREHAKSQDIVGVRTFSLLSLFGVVTVLLSQSIFQNHYLVVIGFITVCAFSLFLYPSTKDKEFSFGFTTNIALIFSYLLGSMVGYGLLIESVFIAVIVALILYSRRRIHKFVHHLTEKEVSDLLSFAILLGIIYPLLPSDPVTLFNIALPLQTVWFLIVIISLINFGSFLGSRFLKAECGVPLSSFMGGLVSATGTAASLSTQLRENKGLKKTLAAGFLFAISALIIKNLGFASLMVFESSRYLVIPLVLGALPLILLGIYRSRNGENGASLSLESPFNVQKATKFGLAILGLIIFVELVKNISPEAVIVTSFLVGIVSSTSMTLSLVSLSLSGSISLSTFLFSIITATLGSFLGNHIILIMGKAKEIVKATIVPVVISLIILLVSFLSIYFFLI